ncbi:MAG: LysR family transcriptional regulator [Anaerolineae bacterium]|nr:LysR family transcriptional regulator [Anaerolineae bacterium]
MLDTHQLNVFLTAAETLSFSEAARRLHMSQPSVSQHIQSLERHFDRELFIRSGRQVLLSDAGRALVPLAREMVNRSEVIEETMRSLDGEVFGHLLVGCSTTPGKYILPHLLARFHRLHPRVKVSCHVAPQERALEMLCSDEIHFSVASAPYLTCRDVELWHYMTDPVVLIAPLGHPWAQRGVIRPQELRDGIFIMREASSGTMAAVTAGLGAHGLSLDELETLLVLGNPEAIALAVQEGLGVGFVSSIVVTKLVQEGVAVVAIEGLHIERDIYIGRHVGRTPSLAQAAFWDFVRDEETANAVDLWNLSLLPVEEL